MGGRTLLLGERKGEGTALSSFWKGCRGAEDRRGGQEEVLWARAGGRAGAPPGPSAGALCVRGGGAEAEPPSSRASAAALLSRGWSRRPQRTVTTRPTSRASCCPQVRTPALPPPATEAGDGTERATLHPLPLRPSVSGAPGWDAPFLGAAPEEDAGCAGKVAKPSSRERGAGEGLRGSLLCLLRLASPRQSRRSGARRIAEAESRSADPLAGRRASARRSAGASMRSSPFPESASPGVAAAEPEPGRKGSGARPPAADGETGRERREQRRPARLRDPAPATQEVGGRLLSPLP